MELPVGGACGLEHRLHDVVRLELPELAVSPEQDARSARILAKSAHETRSVDSRTQLTSHRLRELVRAPDNTLGRTLRNTRGTRDQALVATATRQRRAVSA